MPHFIFEAVLGIWMAVSARINRGATNAAIRRQTWRTDTKGLGIRVNERIRLRFRRTWLRVVPRGAKESH